MKLHDIRCMHCGVLLAEEVEAPSYEEARALIAKLPHPGECHPKPLRELWGKNRKRSGE